MDERPTFVERVPQVFSIAVGVSAVAFGVAWDISKALALVPLAVGAVCLFLRLWLPIRRRRKYGY
jgi:Flp pilus assembly protein TadB